MAWRPASNGRGRRTTTQRRSAAPGGDPGRLLAFAVRGNAAFSATSGLLLLGGGFHIDNALCINAWVLTGMGGGLCLFAAVLLWLLAHQRYLETGARFALAADAAWVIGAL